MDMPQQDGRSALERIKALDWYIPDLETHRLCIKAAQKARKFNELSMVDDTAAFDVLRDLFGTFGEGAYIRGPIQVDYGFNIHWGDSSFANYGLIALDVAPIYIGNSVAIGPNVQLLTPIHPLEVDIRLAGWESAKPIWIEDNVWIGGGAIIMPGVRVGMNSVVGAGAVVTKDVPANVVVAGNPARIIKEIDNN